MTHVVTLHEWGPPQDIELNEQERSRLSAAAAFLQTREIDGGLRIGPREGFVGSLRLSERTMIQVRPKVPVSSFLQLVSLAYRSAPLPSPAGDTLLDEASPSDWFALLLILEIERLHEQGLRRGYISRTEELAYIRGRIDFAPSLASWTRAGTLVCDFSDFLSDTPENRILRGTLELLRLQVLHPEVARRVDHILQTFAETTFIRPSLRDFDRVLLTRLNQHYEAAINLCRLFIAGTGLDAELGDIGVSSFFFPMHEVFERAIGNILIDRLPGRVVLQATTSSAFVHLHGEPPKSITLKPDVLWVQPDGTKLILDTKYANPLVKNQYGGRGFHNSHLYQMATYCLAYDCPGVLVYPKVDDEVASWYMLGSEVEVGVETIDVGAAELLGVYRWIDSLLDHETELLTV